MRLSPERLAELLTGRKASFDPKQSNETFGYSAKVEDLAVDPSSLFVSDPLDDVKLF